MFWGRCPDVLTRNLDGGRERIMCHGHGDEDFEGAVSTTETSFGPSFMRGLERA